MDALSKIFGSPLRVKMIRLFLNNPSEMLSASESGSRLNTNSTSASRELQNLQKIGMLLKKKNAEKGGVVYILNLAFPYNESLRRLVIDTSPIDTEDLLQRLKKTGKISLILVSNIFSKEVEEKADVLIAGEGINMRALDNAMKVVEANMGREIKYAVFSNADFKYRLSMYDRLIKDVLDYPHKVLVNKLGL